uniref:RING-type E3 ubiquitin transferase n=1 Tax=Naja naja TaxID=35670 RepID=A0A8C6X6J5_NAJNA
MSHLPYYTVFMVNHYSRCPICLERIRNVAFLNPCFHRFCFACILEWSDRKAECPLYHSLTAEKHSWRCFMIPV